MTDKTPPRIGRREALALFGGAGAAALLPGAAASAVPAAAASTCILTPEVTEGPYWIANHLTRRNITDGRPGLALRLRLTVVDATTCKTISGADVELWHADASGVYSGFGSSASSQRFLRGHQRADTHGLVIFDTIYPGWYRGRTPHIHIKVHVGGSVVHTGQLFFNDVTSDAVYRTAKLRRPRRARHNQRTGHDLQAGRRLQGTAASDQARGRQGLRRVDHARRAPLREVGRPLARSSGRDSVAPRPGLTPRPGPAITNAARQSHDVVRGRSRRHRGRSDPDRRGLRPVGLPREVDRRAASSAGRRT